MNNLASGILNIYKPQGVTPVQLIADLRSVKPEFKNVKIGFAGRLDPLAHGVMLLTVGEANKERQQYLGLDKTYKFSVLFGVTTDSYDYLGLLETLQVKIAPTDLERRVKEFIIINRGKLTQTYPPFSSKPVNGIPLYKLAKKGDVPKNNLPAKDVEIYKFSLENIETVYSPAIKKIILRNLRRIKGHFRQTKTTKLWGEFFRSYPNHIFKLVSFEIECSSGTYVRSLAYRMGEEFGCGAIAFEIFRTKVGSYGIQDCIKLALVDYVGTYYRNQMYAYTN